jgi:AraC-like DNA-binding protein
MLIGRAAWDMAVTGADSSLFGVLEEHAKLLVARLPRCEGFVGTVRAVIGQELRGGDPSLDHVARKLAMGSRTLQRRLKEDGVAYSRLLDEMRGLLSARI